MSGYILEKLKADWLFLSIADCHFYVLVEIKVTGGMIWSLNKARKEKEKEKGKCDSDSLCKWDLGESIFIVPQGHHSSLTFSSFKISLCIASFSSKILRICLIACFCVVFPLKTSLI